MPHVRSWPRAIVHVDGDAFFASCEQAVNPALKGKPVVTGKERNIVAAASYEAKALGITRGVSLWDAKKMCKDLVVLPSDYETYSLFSKRMFEIMRRYTPTIEEYGIDEGFGELTGLRRVHHCPYPEMARRMKQEIQQALGITVSVGVSTTKTLAKVASKLHKPDGFTVVPNYEREKVLANVPVGYVWNIGPNTSQLLNRYGINTALEFACRTQESLTMLSKPGLESWQELNGIVAWELSCETKETYQSISKTKTFTPPSTDKEYVYTQLMKNVEGACIKARKYHQAATRLVVYLKKQDHRICGVEATLVRPSGYPIELTKVVRELFEQVYVPATQYRATGVVLSNLTSATPTQISLFDAPAQITRMRKLYGAIDELRDKYGKYAVHQGVSLDAQKTQHLSARGDVAVRKSLLLKGESKRRRLPVPMWQVTV